MKSAVLLLGFCLASPVLRSQAQQPEPVGDNLLRVEGTDRDSGIHYTRYIALLRNADIPANASADSLPRFTLECREQSNKRTLHWLVRFDGSGDYAFQRPPVALSPTGFPVQYPTVQLKMRFEGYMRSEEFKRQWERFPTGELHYRNPGVRSGNLDDAQHFMAWLTSLPNLRIGYVKPPENLAPGAPKELVFPLKPVLDAVKKAAFCQP